jgi:zinc finger protein
LIPFSLEHGTSYTVHILSREDLNRQIVKSDSCTVIISEYELTIPPTKGQLTNVEGLIRDVVRDLSAAQPLRRIEAEDQYKKIQHIIDSMEVIIDDEDDNEETKDDGEKKTKPMPAFTIKLDDPAGNSFIEFHESLADPKWNMQTYNRTKQQNIDLGLVSQDEADPEPTPGTLSQKEVLGKLLDGQVDEENPNEEIYVFPGVCSSCGHPLNTMMKKVSIPYFKVCSAISVV